MQADVLVCAPTNDEFAAVLRFLDARGVSHKHNKSTNEFLLQRYDHKYYRVVCVTFGGMGPTSAEGALPPYLDQHSPKLVLLSGIAGVSLQCELTVGDIAVASDIVSHETVEFDKHQATPDLCSVPMLPETQELTSVLNTTSTLLLDAIRRRLEEKRITPPQLSLKRDPKFSFNDELKKHVDSVTARYKRTARGNRQFSSTKFASSGAFHKNPNLAHQVTRGEIDRNAFEMEAAPVFRVCAQKRIPAVMIKAFSDIVGFKSKESSSYARNVAGAAISTILLDSPKFWEWIDRLWREIRVTYRGVHNYDSFLDKVENLRKVPFTKNARIYSP